MHAWRKYERFKVGEGGKAIANDFLPRRSPSVPRKADTLHLSAESHNISVGPELRFEIGPAVATVPSAILCAHVEVQVLYHRSEGRHVTESPQEKFGCLGVVHALGSEPDGDRTIKFLFDDSPPGFADEKKTV